MSFPTSPSEGQVYNNYKYNEVNGLWKVYIPVDTTLDGHSAWDNNSIDEYKYGLELDSAVGNQDGYFTLDEGFELLSIKPTGASKNFVVEGEIHAQSSAVYTTIKFKLLLRSNAEPDLAENLIWSVDSNSNISMIPMIWKKEVIGQEEWKLLIKSTGGSAQNMSVEYNISKRNTADLITPLNIHRNIITVDNGYTEVTSEPRNMTTEWVEDSHKGVLQVVTDTFEGYATTTNFSYNPTSTSGYGLFATAFTPMSATSKILVMTNAISISEELNVGDSAWLGCWHNTTKIAITSGTPAYTHFTGSLATVSHSLNHTCNSWGLTLQNIIIRAGMDNGVAHINGTGYTEYNRNDATIGLTIMEIEG